MKKAIASISFVCYLAVTSGILVNFHYCMNQLASTQFFVTENKSCPKCGMHINKSHGCCHDKVAIIKMEVDQKATSNIVFELPTLQHADHLYSEFFVASYNNVDEVRHFQNHSPPLLSDQDTYLQNCVFRI
jgi:hypothetical protein